MPLSISEVTNLCFHEVINHAPIGIGFHDKLRKGLQSRVKHCVCCHESMIGHRRGSPWRPVTIRNSVKNQVSDGSHAIDPFPLGDLHLSGHLTPTVVTLLHLNGKLLGFHVGSDVVNLNDPTREGGPGATDVVGGFFDFFHDTMMAHPGDPRSLPWYKTGNSSITRAYGSAPIDPPLLIRIRISKNITLRIRSGSRPKYKTVAYEFFISNNEWVSIAMWQQSYCPLYLHFVFFYGSINFFVAMEV